MENEGFENNTLHIPDGGVSVEPVLVSAATWDARTATDIVSASDSAKHITLVSRIVDDEDIVFGMAQTEAAVEPGEALRLVQSVLCYGVQTDAEYTMVTELSADGAVTDEKRTRFGFCG